MIQSGLVAFFIFDRIAKSIAQPQHPFIGGLATCCNIVHLVGKSLPLLILSRTFFLKFQFSPYLRTKHDFSKKNFFTGSAAKLIGTKSGGMLYYFNSLLIKKNPSPQPAAGAEFVFWFCAASFTCLWHRQYCWWIRCYCSLILPYDNSIIIRREFRVHYFSVFTSLPWLPITVLVPILTLLYFSWQTKSNWVENKNPLF